MKKIQFFLVCCAFIIGSCTEKEIENPNLDLSDLKLDLDMNLTNTYKVSSLDEANEIVNKYLELLALDKIDGNASGRVTDDSSDFGGLLFQLEDGTLVIDPVEDGDLGVDANECGEGWTDEGKCLTKGCVTEKIEKALAPVSEEVGCVQVKVIRKSLYARVCSKGC
ncbi:MAG: hypothetical protein O9262_02040 [Cyclobacteriaceae bacterium]|nr:hypothetical protein [Cyclobacteriaceae bacterium]